MNLIIDSTTKTIELNRQLLFGNGKNANKKYKYSITDGILKIDVNSFTDNEVKILLKEIKENIHLFKSQIKDIQILND